MSNFFINRPIVAMVISILMVIVGAITIATLPVSQFPSIAPPEVQIQANYVGADSQTVEQSVATPIEQQMSGVDNLNYMYSLNAANGQMTMIVDFDVKTEPNTDQILTQMRETQAASQLPVDVTNYGVTVQKSVTAPLMVIGLYSPHGTYNAQFLANYSYINLNDRLTRVPGIGNVQVFGAGQYAMRLWVKPDQLAKLGITVPEIVSAIQSQNTVNPAGQIGGAPVAKGQEFTYTVRAQGRLTSPEEFGEIIVRETPDGGLRRATEAARASLLSAEENRKAVVTTLVADVATDYFTLRELDDEMDISERTLSSRRESLQLIESRQGGGVATLLDRRQGEQLVYTASETIPGLQQQIEQTENQISLLLARNPGGVERGRRLTEQELPPEVPTGLPSALLERRPDIQAAEQNLIAANANIGVAKAAYFPQISLSGFLGGQSTQLASLFNGPHSAWGFVPQVTQPIFTAGRLKSTVHLAEAQQQGALVEYEKTIQTAFTEVSNALIAHQRVRESRIQQEALVEALRDRNRLAYVRYQGGVDTLLNALDADRDLFQAQLALSQIQLNELLSVVQLYKALGGGWQ